MKNIEEYAKLEKNLSDMEYDLITEYVRLRKEKKLSQQDIADHSKIIRTTVARIENHVNSPQVKTMLQLLAPLGYTLKIEKMKK